MKKWNHGALTFLGTVMIIYGLIYALLGTLSLTETIIGVLPGHEQKEIIIIILSYTITLISVVCGIMNIKGKYKNAKIISILLAAIGLISLIYTQITQNMFSSFDCIAIVLSTGIFYLNLLAEKRHIKFLKAQKQKNKRLLKRENQIKLQQKKEK